MVWKRLSRCDEFSGEFKLEEFLRKFHFERFYIDSIR